MHPLVSLLTRPLTGGRSESPAREQLHRLLSELAADQPAAAARRLASDLPRLLASESAPERQLKLLDTARDTAEGLLPIIEHDVECATLPLTRAQIADALAADNLLKALAGEYQRIALGLAMRGHSPRDSRLGPATQSAIRQLLRRQLLACRAGKTASSSSWRRLHRLYRLARDRAYADHSDAMGSIEADYLAAVLLVLAEPSGVPRAELPAMLKAIGRLAPLARLREVDADARNRGSVLLVSPLDDRPSIGRPEEGARDASWQLDLDPVIERLQADIRACELTQAADPGIATPVPRKVLVRLLECWRRQPVRRFTRQSMRPRVDVVTGLDHLWWALSHPIPARQLAGGIRPRPDDTAEWVIANESADGFGLCQIRGGRPDIDVGDIIGVGLRDVSRLHPCIVRRIDEDRRGRCQLGVQHLSPDAEAVVLVDARTNRQQAVIRFSCLPALGGCAGVAAPAGQLTRGSKVHTIGESDCLVIGETCEDNTRHALFLIGSPEPPT